MVSEDGGSSRKLWITGSHNVNLNRYYLVWTDYRFGPGCIGSAWLTGNGAIVVNSSKKKKKEKEREGRKKKIFLNSFLS